MDASGSGFGPFLITQHVVFKAVLFLMSQVVRSKSCLAQTFGLQGQCSPDATSHTFENASASMTGDDAS